MVQHHRRSVCSVAINNDGSQWFLANLRRLFRSNCLELVLVVARDITSPLRARKRATIQREAILFNIAGNRDAAIRTLPLRAALRDGKRTD